MKLWMELCLKNTSSYKQNNKHGISNGTLRMLPSLLFPSNQVRPLCMSHQGGPIRARERKVVFKAVLRTLNLQGLTWAHRELVPQERDPTRVKCQGRQLAAGTGILHSLGVLHLMFLAFFFFGLSVEVVFCRGRSLYRKQLKNNHHHHEETCLFVPQA